MVCILHGYYDAQPKMRFSLSPPPQKTITTTSLTSPTSSTSTSISSSCTTTNIHINNNRSGSNIGRSPNSHNNNMLPRNGEEPDSSLNASDDDAASDYNQWLHAMKLVARLPGGTPPEFRRKLWLSLADKYLKSKNVDWTQQREKCFCEEWREDDEELGIQIVKDLHRTGSNLCTGPAGSINQAKLKRILLGYARYNPEVGYCQGFNMLGALILQVMDKEEEESMKVMIYLVEGVLPTGYFYGSMGGLQADMGVFRELMQTKLPRLAKHLQRLQGGPVENAYEPPLTNVFTMQWFLTMFCTCLPMSCVLRVWDLVLIEGSDVLLRTALVLWGLLEERILCARTADEFYGKMGSFSSELLNGHLIDSNGLIEKIVKLGSIPDLRQLRDKHLYNIAPLRQKQGLQLYYDEEDTHSDEERMAVATVWGLNWGRRGSVGPGVTVSKQQTEHKDRLALDISLLKKQYDRLRERQKQAHVILTSACSTTSRQGSTGNTQTSLPVNQLLLGRPAIVTNKGKRVNPPLGAIPPARKPSLPAVLHSQPKVGEKQLRRGETLLWRDTDASRRRRDSLTWKEIKADRAALLRQGSEIGSLKTQKLRTRMGKSDSSSYSEESDAEQETGEGGNGGSSTDTSLCDDDDPKSTEKSPKRKAKAARKLKEKPQTTGSRESSLERRRPKSWAPTTHEIPFMLMGTESGDEKESLSSTVVKQEDEDSATESGRFSYEPQLDWSQAAGDLACGRREPLHLQVETEKPGTTSLGELSPLPDIASYLDVSPLPAPKPVVSKDSIKGEGEAELESITKQYDVSDHGVTNQYFERVNSVERPSRLELDYSLNEVESKQMEGPTNHVLSPETEPGSKVPQIRDDNIPGENKDDYKEVLSMTIEAPKPSTSPATTSLRQKRRDPRRKTLTRSSTIEIEERFLALERRLSQEQPPRQCDKKAKLIPSTASLEVRYNTLEKQLSAEKQRMETERVPLTLQKQQSAEKQRQEQENASFNLENTSVLQLSAECQRNEKELAPSALEKRQSLENENAHFTLEKQASAEKLLQEEESSTWIQNKQLSFEKKQAHSSLGKQHRTEKQREEREYEPSNLVKEPSLKNENSHSNLERKLSAEKQRKRKEHIPSTADLETRFNALTKQMSSSEPNSKTPIDLTHKEEPAKGEKGTEQKDSGMPNKANESEDTSSELKKTASKTESSDEMESRKPQRETEQPRLKKLPSTAELEDRFNALERKMSVRKSSPAKTKKEPPDEEATGEEKKERKEPKTKSAVNEHERVDANSSSEKGHSLKKESTTKPEENKPAMAKSPSEIADKANSAESKENIKEDLVDESFIRKTPPSTEELEKRYNALEKQLSTQNIDSEPTKSGAQSTPKKVETEKEVPRSEHHFEDKVEAVNKVLTTEEEHKNEPKEETTDLKKSEVFQVKKSSEIPPTELTKRRASEPPSTEDLEKRYETLKRCMSSKNNFAAPNETVSEALERTEHEVISEIDEKKQPPPTTEDLESRYEALQSKAKPKTPPKQVDVAIEAHIPPPPLPPPKPKPHTDPAIHQQRALIEELQSKMQTQSLGEENLKPSEINPQRKRPLQQRPTTMGDETSEAPANTAYYRSGNYEPWQQQSQRMVRRFSDLPSRADLENRLQFLEKQLYKKFYKQRCAGDSEVASRASDDRPSTSARRAEVQLEQRVLALEKQLSENSLKLLAPVDTRSPRRLSTDTIDATGKELVRYTQNFGEVEEAGGDGHKPINISINIKMLLNKEQQKSEPRLSTTEDLKQRLFQLEQELQEERAKNGTVMSENESDAELEKQAEKCEESEACQKQEKDCHNQTQKMEENIAPETVKETKTLENEEIAQAGQEKALKDDQKEEPETELKVEEKEETVTEPENPPIQEESTSNDVHCSTKKCEVNDESAKMIINTDDLVPVDAINKTVVLLMDNEPRASRVRRLTRANTEELEGLFQALEKQLLNRNLIKSEDGKLIRAPETIPTAEQAEQAQAISALTKEIEDFTSDKPEPKSEAEVKKELPVDNSDDYDWGPNPVKHHLKRKTVYLPSTKELEARFRSLERQIKLLEDVEKIDVEQRLIEIERKIKLQYSLSHEKDLNKYLELCEGKGLDDDDEQVPEEDSPPPATQRSRSPARKEASKSPYTSPSRKSITKSPYTSPSRKANTKSPYTSPPRQRQKTPHTSPARTRRQPHPGDLPISDDPEYKYRVLDLVRSKSKDNLSKRKNDRNKKSPIHPLEMLLDPSPDDSDIPTTGELEHRIRLLDEKLKSPARHRSRSRSRSPTIDDIKRQKMLNEQHRPRTPVHSLERLVSSPSKPEPPTAEELDQRMRALEEKQCFDFKTQKDYKEFNRKLKDVVSPSLSFEEFKAAKSREQSPRRQGATTPKSALRRDEELPHYRPTSPKVIRFRDEDEDYYEDTTQRLKRRQTSERMKTLADHQPTTAVRNYSSSSEGLDALGSRLMRETSPITRTGTHTGVPLRTGENINDRLSSIKDTIKSIDTLCEEKPYQKEKCQRYIDSLFSDSLHFASKKSSVEDLTHSRSESRGRTTQRTSDYNSPSIRITSEHRSLGSRESLRTSPLRGSSPSHYRSHRDISRELSPRRRREDEEREERESSRVRRDNMLPNYFLDNRSELSSGGSLTKFHKVDRQLEETCSKYEADDRRSASRTPLSSPYETRTTATRYHTTTSTASGTTTTSDSFQKPVSPYRQPYDPYRRSNAAATVYQPAKLEIRHTTVTSTFYDRFLTEKQIEKQCLSRPPSRSPVISPTATSKSYSDLPDTLNAVSISTTTSTTTTTMSSSYSGTSSNAFSLPRSNYSYLSSDTVLTTTSIPTAISTTTLSNSVGVSAYVPYKFTSSFPNRLSDPIATSGISSGSTGVYNPMMTFTLREPIPPPSAPLSSTSGLLGQYQLKSTFSSNYISSTTKSPSDQDKL